MNEKHSGVGMEAELCSRAKLSKLLKSWIDLQPELCGGDPFVLQEQDNSANARPLAQPGDTTPLDNDERWGLQNETSLLHWVF